MGNNLKAGMAARLRIGGPTMVIFAIKADRAYCRWLIGRTLYGETYKVADLEPA